MDPQHVPTPAQEVARYQEHNNDPRDERYRTFLNRLAIPFLAQLHAVYSRDSPNQPDGEALKILDFGSGPVPVLGEMLRESGHDVALYDPFFAPEQQVLQTNTYHGIVCCETAEHFHRPGSVFQQLFTYLRQAGTLGVMTTFLTEKTQFDRWYYRDDHTHVFFYRRTTMEWIANHWGYSLTVPRENVALFTHPAGVIHGETSRPG